MDAPVRQAWSLAVLTGIVLLGALPVETWDRVPSLCLWRNLFGVRCLGCGGVHAVAALLHGDIVSAVQYNALAPVIAIGLATAAIRGLAPPRWRRATAR